MTDYTNLIGWNDPEIIMAAGPAPDAVRALLRAHSQPEPTDQAIYQWASRKRIPDKWRPAVVYALMRENKLPLAKLFRRRKPLAQ